MIIVGALATWLTSLNLASCVATFLVAGPFNDSPRFQISACRFDESEAARYVGKAESVRRAPMRAPIATPPTRANRRATARYPRHR
jgi:hypothetical protein